MEITKRIVTEKVGEGQRRSEKHGNHVTRILHNSISPLRPNPEAVSTEKSVTLRYKSLGVFSGDGKKNFLLVALHITINNNNMTPAEEKRARLEQLRLERARQDEERERREAQQREQERLLELEVLREEEEERHRLEEKEKKRQEELERAAALVRKKVERSWAAQEEKRRSQTAGKPESSGAGESPCWECKRRGRECERPG